MRLFAACLALLFGASLATAGPSGPSFDCRRASTPVEKAICADPKLAALDRRVAREYAEALKRLDAKGAALRQDQRSFLATLAYGLERDEGQPKDKRVFDLDDALGQRADFLATIRAAPAAQWAGDWSNHFSGIEIREKDGRLHVAVNGAMPVTGNWVCTLEGRATVEGESLSVAGDDDGKPDGWTYRLARDGDRIVLSQRGPKGQSYGSPSCGHNGSMEGNYFFTVKPGAPERAAPRLSR